MLASQQLVTHEAAIAPIVPQLTFVDPDAMELPDQALIHEAFDDIISEVLHSSIDGAHSKDKDLDSSQRSGEEIDPMPYSHPMRIYPRHVAAREAWYLSLPRGSVKTNQLYRKAQRLPIQYSKSDFNWCLDYKQMGCVNGSKAWTKEEMTAYLDWSYMEDERERAEARITTQGDLNSQRRGTAQIWDDIEADTAEQEAIYGK